MSDDRKELWLKAREDRRLRAGHLWIYSNEVDTGRTPLRDFDAGELVAVRAHGGRPVGVATVNPHCLITGRLLDRRADTAVDAGWLGRRITRALALRETLYGPPWYRLLFGESDGVPGLVADRFGDYLVLQASTAGAERLKGAVIDAVVAALEPAGVLWRNDARSREAEGLDSYVEVAHGHVPERVTVHEGDVGFETDLHGGQKTGWFYDQRDNRARLGRYARDARVLDVFCYAGAWGHAALAAGARDATFLDSSRPALDLVEATAGQRGAAVETLHGNAFDVLASLRADHRRFDLVIVDPPAFVKRRKDLKQGAAAYRRVNQMAMQLVEPGGYLVSCTCSHHMPGAELVNALQAAGRHLDRFVQVTEMGGQSADHPLHPAIPETRYLKAVFARILPA